MPGDIARGSQTCAPTSNPAGVLVVCRLVLLSQLQDAQLLVASPHAHTHTHVERDRRAIGVVCSECDAKSVHSGMSRLHVKAASGSHRVACVWPDKTLQMTGDLQELVGELCTAVQGLELHGAVPSLRGLAAQRLPRDQQRAWIVSNPTGARCDEEAEVPQCNVAATACFRVCQSAVSSDAGQIAHRPRASCRRLSQDLKECDIPEQKATSNCVRGVAHGR